MVHESLSSSTSRKAQDVGDFKCSPTNEASHLRHKLSVSSQGPEVKCDKGFTCHPILSAPQTLQFANTVGSTWVNLPPQVTPTGHFMLILQFS